MYIIPKEKIARIEKEVKPVFLKKVSRMVKQGIEEAVAEVNAKSKIKFNDSGLFDWCNKLGKDLLDSKSEIYYKTIIESPPNLLMEIYGRFRNKYNYNIIYKGKEYCLFEENGWDQAKKVPDLTMAKKFLTRCFPYNRFTSKDEKYDAYKYCKAMDISVCVYCNAQLTHTVVRRYKKIIRPQIDHFFPQSRFPMFALSFYNMIPACQSCNKIKRDGFYSLDKIYHPYIEDCTDLRFRWRYNRIQVKYAFEKTKNMVQMLHTTDVYRMYDGIAEKIVEKVQDYDPAYIDELMELMNSHRPKDKQLDQETVIKRIYDYVPREECFDTPLGEMRHDILEDRLKKAYKWSGGDKQ